MSGIGGIGGWINVVIVDKRVMIKYLWEMRCWIAVVNLNCAFV